jgi:hypothetical protein
MLPWIADYKIIFTYVSRIQNPKSGMVCFIFSCDRVNWQNRLLCFHESQQILQITCTYIYEREREREREGGGKDAFYIASTEKDTPCVLQS